VVTADDVQKPLADREAYQLALSELGIGEENALAVTGSAAGLREAKSIGLPTVVITGSGTPDFPAAVAVHADYGGTGPLRVADCQRRHRRWNAERKPADAA
jgi:beta-phosphoglucomutase-like phosphatase (HAD superfamily)